MFSVCSQCHRHVRLEDERCPFCDNAERNHGGTPAGALLAVALGAAVAIGCGGETDSTGGVGGAASTGGVGGANVGGANVGGAQGGSANRGGATSYPSGGLMAPYGLPPSGGTTSVAVYGLSPLGGNTSTGGTDNASKASAGDAGQK